MSVAGERASYGLLQSPVSLVLKRVVAWVLLFAGLACLFLALNFAVSDPVHTADFAGFYATGAILQQGAGKQLYDVDVQQRVEHQFLPGGRFFPLDHPPFEAWLCLPFAYLPYRQAYMAWAGLNLLVLALIFYFLPRTGYRLDADSRLVWLAAIFPLVAGVLVLGQDSLLLAPVFLFAFLALKKQHDFAAGLILGVGLFRFEIMLPFIFIFLLRRRSKLVGGFFAASVVALFSSLATVGWRGMSEYAKVLVEVGRAAGSRVNGVTTVTMPSLRGAVATFLGGMIPSQLLFPVVLGGTLALLVWAARQFRHAHDPENPSFDLEFSLATVAALLSSYHVFVHELTPLIVVVFLFLGREATMRRNEAILKRPGTQLLLLFSLVLIVGGAVGFRAFSVVFVVLLGLMIWLSQEISSLGGEGLSG